MTNDRVCANDTTMPRRSVLAALPATGMAFAATASAEENDPVLDLYQEWLKALLGWQRLSRMNGHAEDTQEMIDLVDRRFDLLDQIVDSTPRSLEGVAALAHVTWEEAGPCILEGAEGSEEELSLPIHRALRSMMKLSKSPCPPFFVA